jgi:potassium-transporting ATPase KdpC subunit
MLNMIRSSLVILLTLAVLTGIIYPVLVTVIAQRVFPHQANGSIIEKEGKSVGSGLIGQSFSKPEYFWSRLSATSPVPFNAAASGGSNFGPLNPELKKAAEARIAMLQNYSSTKPVPVDLVTASGSGLDPHISPAAAEYQVSRIAQARKASENDIRRLVARSTEERQLGVLGEARVNVLLLNLALDQQFPVVK